MVFALFYVGRIRGTCPVQRSIRLLLNVNHLQLFLGLSDLTRFSRYPFDFPSSREIEIMMCPSAVTLAMSLG